MKQQFAIGAKKSGAVAAVVRLPGVGRNQSVGSCLCTDQSVDQKFVSSAWSKQLQGGRWSVTWDLGSDLALAWPDFGHVIPTHHLHYTQHTTHDIPIQHIIIDSRPYRNPPYHRGHHLDANLVRA